MCDNTVKIDFYKSFEIWDDFRRIDILIESNIFYDEKLSLFWRAALTEILVCMRDLIAKAECYCSKPTFADDVVITGNIKNVSDLITEMRDIVCHKHLLDKTLVSQNFRVPIFIAKGLYSFNTPFGNIKSEYEDDICFLSGNLKLYLNRHIVKAYNELRQNLTSLLVFNYHGRSGSTMEAD